MGVSGGGCATERALQGTSPLLLSYAFFYYWLPYRPIQSPNGFAIVLHILLLIVLSSYAFAVLSPTHSPLSSYAFSAIILCTGYARIAGSESRCGGARR
eukprot:3241872-Rhodomonas_salina.3